ncbi:unnamed protein product [Ascophyllum nodosum]
MTDGPTLITQLPGYPEERPETDELDGVLEHLASELEGKQVLEKPRVSKKVMVFALKEQNHIIGQLRREANANFMLLDDRSRRTHDIVQKLMGKIDAQDAQLQKSNETITTLQGEMVQMRSKVEEALKLSDAAKKMEEMTVSGQQTVETLTAKLQMHESHFKEFDRLAGRVKLVEESLNHIPGDNVLVITDRMGEPMSLNKVAQNLQATLSEYDDKIKEQFKMQRQQSESIANTEAELTEGVRINSENIEELQASESHFFEKLAENHGIDLAEIQRVQTTMVDQLEVLQQQLGTTIDKSYVDEHVEGKYEEIVNHLHKALSSTEEDERDSRRRASNLESIIEQLSANKADREELLELKRFVMPSKERRNSAEMERRRSTRYSLGNIGGQVGGNSLTSPITRDEVFNLLEEKTDKKDLEKRIAALMTRVNDTVIRKGGSMSGHGPFPPGPAGLNGFGGTPATRDGLGFLAIILHTDISTTLDCAAWEPDLDGALAISKQLTDGFGKAVKPDGMVLGTCLSCKAPVVHPYQVDLFPGVSRGGGYQLWAPYGKGPPLRTPPGDTLPELEATEGRHIIGKDGNLYLAQTACSAAVDIRLGQMFQQPQTAEG